MKKRLRYRIILQPAEEGGYTVIVPALPGCISEGDTKKEALKNIQEAIGVGLMFPGNMATRFLPVTS